MGQAITIEKWAENLEEVTLSEWLHEPGESLAAGNDLCVIITEKITFEYELEQGGVLHRQYCPEGSTVPVGYVIAWLGAPDEPPPHRILEENAALVLEYRERLKIELNEGEKDMLPPPETGRIAASPAARRLARERGVALEEVAAFRGGAERLSEADVQVYLDSREGG